MIIMLVLFALLAASFLLTLLIHPDPSVLNEFITRLNPVLSQNNPSMDQIQSIVSQFPPELLNKIVRYVTFLLLINIINLIITQGIIITVIDLISTNQPATLANIISQFIKLMPKLLITILLILPFSLLLIFLSALLGSIFSILFMVIISIAFILLPSILVIDHNSSLNTIMTSIKTGLTNYTITMPITLLYIAGILLLTRLSITGSVNDLTGSLYSILSNGLSFFIATYCYRFYSLYKQNNTQ